jgi:glycosyltransferase involved in cell wall biosynthesis
MAEPSFIVFGDDWGAHPSSVQHVFKRLARTHRTLWVNTLGLRPPRLDRRDAARVVRKLRAMLGPRAEASAPGPGPDRDLDLHVVAPPMLPWMRPAPLRLANRESVRFVVGRAAARLGLRDPVVVTTVPNGVDGRGLAGSRCLVYYCVDDFTSWPGVDRAAAASLERELLDTCDAVLATSQNLADTRRPRRGAATLLPHGVDVEHLATACDPGTPALAGVRRGRPVLGYLGLVDARLDVELVMGVARARPDWDLVFVGPTDTAPDPRLRGDNVRFVPAVAYGRLPEALAAFDVAMLPYVKSELTRSINPLKLREYLASGRPIVATSLPEVARYAPEVRLADTAADTVTAVAAALAGPSDRRAARAPLLAGETWDDRARTFLDRCLAARDGAPATPRDPA